MKRIFILSSNAILGQGIEQLLLQHQELQIVGRESDVEKALDRIKLHAPEVVILECDPATDTLQRVVATVALDSPETRVIELSLKDNTINIFLKCQRKVRGIDDLLSAIHEPGAEIAQVPEVSSGPGVEEVK